MILDKNFSMLLAPAILQEGNEHSKDRHPKERTKTHTRSHTHTHTHTHTRSHTHTVTHAQHTHNTHT